jgi:POT family proton-dependent oligopeptide transporter
MHFGSRFALAEGKVSPGWLLAAYLLLTWGELTLSPVGLSAVTKLAPARLATQAIGIWFLATSLGNLLAGRLAGEMTGEHAHAMPALFMQIVFTAGGVAVLLAIFARPLKRLASGAE